MARKALHVLASPSASATFSVILAYKNGFDENGMPVSVYKLAKKVYGKEEFYSPVRVYNVLKKFREENLIEEESIAINKRNAKIVKPNLKRFVEMLNDILIPNEHKLTEEEIKKLAEVLEKVDYSKLGFAAEGGLKKQKINVLDAVAIFLKAGRAYIKAARERKVDPQKLNEFLETALDKVTSMFGIPAKEMVQQYNVLFSLDDTILEKLEHIKVPELVEGLLLISTAIGEFAAEILKEVSEKKQQTS